MSFQGLLSCLLLLGGLGACAADVSSDALGAGGDVDSEFTQTDQQAWDSQHNNPTHATHSYLTEYAIAQVGRSYPEVLAYQTELVTGANTEVHELPTGSDDLEMLRMDVEGTNGACKHPERLWARADGDYKANLKPRAFFLLGLLLHYVEDLGVPAHALGVEHQGTWSQMDNFEMMATMKWSPDYTTVNRGNPYLATPDAYAAFSADWARADFATAFPGQTYTRTFFPKTWLFASKKYTSVVKQRQARTALAARWALDSAMYAWTHP